MTATAAGVEHLNREQLDAEIEKFRQLVIAAKSSAKVEGAAREAQGRLNALYKLDPKLFTEEDVRWLNVLCGYLGVRLDSHKPQREHTRKAKRKGDRLDHCWRCQTPVDERFGETCPTCSTKKEPWMICPVCGACGCQRTGQALV
jgi:hypothetical protein